MNAEEAVNRIMETGRLMSVLEQMTVVMALANHAVDCAPCRALLHLMLRHIGETKQP